ncbi:MAG TPA: hypothetical protein VF677_12170 [Flavobacterium sp.]|jgi:hypothetical protein
MENKKMQENILWNNNFDSSLVSQKKIDKEILNKFIGMFDYGAASTLNWLIAKLKIIKSIINEKSSVTIEEDPVLILSTQEDLKNWIKGRFDESLIEDVFEV